VGLKAYLDQNWAPKAGVTAGLGFSLNQDGLQLGFNGSVKLGSDLIHVDLNAGLAQYGLAVDAGVDLQAKVNAAVDLGFKLDWRRGLKADFALNKLSFDGTLRADDFLLAARLGPLDIGIGREGVDSGGKPYQRGALSLALAGSLSYTGGAFRFTAGNNDLSLRAPALRHRSPVWTWATETRRSSP
jgi:hypothetical protein